MYLLCMFAGPQSVKWLEVTFKKMALTQLIKFVYGGACSEGLKQRILKY